MLYMKIKRYGINVREITHQPQEKNRVYTNLEVSTGLNTIHCEKLEINNKKRVYIRNVFLYITYCLH